MREFLEAVEDHLCVAVFVAFVLVAVITALTGRGR